MQLMRIGERNSERPVVRADDGTLYELSPLTGDIDGAFLADDGIGRARAALAAHDLPAVPDADRVRIGAPVARPGKIVCIGLNYRDHAAETGSPLPAEPIVFMKAPNTIVGPHDPVLVPRGSTKTDWEIELGVIIGRHARYLGSPDEAADVIAGFAISNDVSEREFQLERGGQWDKGKSCETFNPLGPWLVPTDEITDPGKLGLRLWVNRELRQDGTTADLVFGIDHVIWYLSQFMVLEPGDLINTGTPAGVALGRPDQPYLRAGDVLELEIDGLGRQHQLLQNA
ncbi:FAA hydrolase family protein [Jiangella ureilytica]|uniref:FAA hydrolase family protein n=1 Tax=Jiangella ureilytica TaxID=2530374 RepID=A0A4R4RTV8_9ACTN|nr:fumarylacetoacetate hydrolase family protein [Jiangella ureilytica]TDC52749.1 FAA hydrolase family protein [Jiangella ureilytica]